MFHRSCLLSTICLLSAIEAHAQDFDELVGIEVPGGFSPPVAHFVPLTSGTFTLAPNAVAPGAPQPWAPGPAQQGGADVDPGLPGIAVTDGFGYSVIGLPHYSPVVPPLPYQPFPMTVMNGLQAPAVDVAYAGGTQWWLGSANGRFLKFDFMIGQVVGSVQQVAGLSNVAGFDRRGDWLRCCSTTGVRIDVDTTTWMLRPAVPPLVPVPYPVIDFTSDVGRRDLALCSNGEVVDLDAAGSPVTVWASTFRGLARHQTPVRRTSCGAASGRLRARLFNFGGRPDGGFDVVGAPANRLGLFALADGFLPVGLPVGGAGCGVHVGGNIAIGAFVTNGSGFAPFPFAYPPTTLPTIPFTCQAATLGTDADVMDAVTLQLSPHP
jgi:hypothetical protein